MIYSDLSFWQSYAESKIKRKIDKELSEGIGDEKTKLFCIFVIAPIPLAMFLGNCVGDTIPTNLYQSHRDIADTNKTWTWKKAKPKNFRYIVNELIVDEGARFS